MWPVQARLIAQASGQTPLIVVPRPAQIIAASQDAAPADAGQRMELEKSLDKTVARCHGACAAPHGHWPER